MSSRVNQPHHSSQHHLTVTMWSPSMTEASDVCPALTQLFSCHPPTEAGVQLPYSWTCSELRAAPGSERERLLERCCSVEVRLAWYVSTNTSLRHSHLGHIIHSNSNTILFSLKFQHHYQNIEENNDSFFNFILFGAYISHQCELCSLIPWRRL